MIRVENLSKQYRIGQYEAAYKTLRESIMNVFSRRDGNRETIWALKDVSFQVNRGEVVGIIGRNGAGKSTLLKILCRVTEPTEGHAYINGRVGSLLEVGTGFHPELTGSENIFLNGAILGMRKAEIERKFDEIVAFAEIEKFIDTPVKRYSSGMYVRLAFAVAAHLEPEILLVDEVLAVGDVAFQKKCLGKMENISKQGRTVLFVSHNMAAINALCDRVIFLDEGKIMEIGRTADVIAEYLSSIQKFSEQSLRERMDRSGTGKARITNISLVSTDGETLEQLLSGYECMLTLEYESSESLARPVFKFTVYNSIGQALLHFDSSLINAWFHQLPAKGRVGCRFGGLPLSRGTYRLNASIEDNGQLLDHVTGAYSFVVNDGDFYGTGRSITGLREICLVNQEWLVLGESELRTIEPEAH